MMQSVGMNPKVARLFHEGQTTLALIIPEIQPSEPPAEPLPMDDVDE
jgi:hypothetical protein